jgi:polysaccharide pyruvyl transferase WcaK-like protein
MRKPDTIADKGAKSGSMRWHGGKRKKIAFYGLFGQQNWGNEATLQAIVFNTRRYLPDVELRCICTGPDDTARRHSIQSFPCSSQYAKGYSAVAATKPTPAVRLLRALLHRVPNELWSWLTGLKTLMGCHWLIVPGTGLLTDFSSGPLGFLYPLLKWSLIAKLCGCRLFFVSVGAGPMYHPITKWLVRAVLWLADYRSYRDLYSKRFIEAIGFKTDRDRLYPDLAFSLPRGFFPECSPKNAHAKTVVAVGVKDYCGKLGMPHRTGEAKYRAFIDKLATFVAWLLQSNHAVRLLVGDTLHDNRVKQDLIDLLENRGLRSEDWNIINESIQSVEGVLSELAHADIVVSARFHNILLALMFDKPAISLSYHKKFESLMESIGLGSYSHDIDFLDVHKLQEDLMRLEKDASELRPFIRQRVEEYRNALEEQYRLIFNCDPVENVEII